MSNVILPLSNFVTSVRKELAKGDASSFWGLRALLSDFVVGGGLTDAINDQVMRLRADPHYTNEWSALELFIHKERSWSISIAVLDAPRRYIHAISELAFFVPLNKAGLKAKRYALPESYRNDLFDPAVSLTPAGEISAEPLEPLALESDRYAYDFQPTEATPVARLMTAPVKPLEWLFSKATLQAWQANDADIAFTQLRVAAYVLGKVAHQSSVEPLKKLSAHPHHAVRWAAIQNLGRLNRSEALVKIREAVSDPHPHVRRAAQKTLEQIQKRST